MAKGFKVGGELAREISLDTSSLVVAVPVQGRGLSAVTEQWRLAKEVGANLVEWRVDALKDLALTAHGPQLRQQFALPVLYTVRSAKEGGLYEGPGYWDAVLRGLPWADLLDIEWEHPDRSGLLAAAQESAVPVVASHHVLRAPVDVERLVGILTDMAQGGAAVAKVAWMVESPADVESVHEVQSWAATELPVPAVIIGMGAAGASTRVGAAARRSAFTFAVGAQASAPGQLTVAQVLGADS